MGSVCSTFQCFTVVGECVTSVPIIPIVPISHPSTPILLVRQRAERERVTLITQLAPLAAQLAVKSHTSIEFHAMAQAVQVRVRQCWILGNALAAALRVDRLVDPANHILWVGCHKV